MNELVEWLRAQLDDDEAYARNAVGDHNEAVPEWTEIWSGAVQVGPHEDLVLASDSQVARHMVRHDPARVLREVEAKRKILALTRFEAQFPDSDGGYDSACEDVIKLLALPFADRPGYQEEWRP